ncbi:unnamed protein product [Trifolium pratense]|uniref:Uncharacterized protein n=1 Tax=Trifolium pratense TaxID=57577 RepID=A0ACB0LSY0_TRIPR|nr:unnamed protein product [Trifolium pratense]
MEGVVVQNGLLPGSSWPNNQFTRYENNNQGNYLEQMRGSLMVVATVIASLTFQIAINPPGGVWQSNTKSEDGCAPNQICKAGTSVLAFGDNDNNKFRYEVFILLCTISFSASQAIIVLLICGFPLRNKLVMWLLIIVTCVSVFCTAGAYVISLSMILDPLDGTLYHIILYYGIFWIGLIVLLVIIFFVRFVFWLLKTFFRFLCCCW